MKLVRPGWLAHQDENRTFEIYSLDASPDNKRLVTGGLDSKVKVWATGGIDDPENEARPRLLASMAAHTGAVTAVAFSPDGRYIASGSDDRIVLVSELDTSRPPRREFGSTQSAEHEVWTPRKRLVGHDNDVQDLAWSPDGQLLVSVGLDSAIIVWSGTTFEKLKRLDWHQSHVKGVAFDPANKFFVTCSDDRTARIVRYSRASPTELSFSVEAVVSQPFVDSPLTTYFRRCSWSPDGESIATPNATNGPIPTVAITDRGQWSTPQTKQISLVGHEGTTEVARFSPRMYVLHENAPGCIIATAGEDGAVAVWTTENTRPLVVVRNIATKMITDMAWARSGLALYVSSLDGSVVKLVFSKSELGDVLSLEESQRRLEKYGNATDLMDIPQSVEQIAVTQAVHDKRAAAAAAGDAKGLPKRPQPDPGASRSQNGADGRLASPKGPVRSGPSGPELGSQEPGSQRAEGQQAPPRADGSHEAAGPEGAAGAPSASAEHTAARSSEPLPSTPLQTPAQAEAHAESRGPPLNGVIPSATSTDTAADAPAPAADSISASTSAVAPATAPALPAAAANDAAAPSERPQPPLSTPAPVRQKTSLTRDGRKRVAPMLLNSSGASAAPLASPQQSTAGAPQARSQVSQQFDRPSAALPPGGIASIIVGNKRKNEEDMIPPKRQKEDTTYIRPVVLNPSTTVSQVRLATPRVLSHLSSDAAAATVLEARNATRIGDPTRITVVSRGHVVFTDFIAEYASLLAGSAEHFWAVASDTGVLYVYTPRGSRKLPPLVLGAPVSVLESRNQYLCAITATGLVYMWDTAERRALFPPTSIGPCLDLGSKIQENGLVRAPQIVQAIVTEKGHIVIALSNGAGYHYNSLLGVWERVSESFWAYGSQFWDSTGLKSAGQQGPVATAERRTNEEALLKAGARGRQLQRQAVNRMVQAGFQGFEEAVSLAHLGNRVAAAVSLDSPAEAQRFTVQYVRRLAERGDRLKLDEVFRTLRSSGQAKMLLEVLEVAAEFKGVQTLVAEYADTAPAYAA